MDNKNLKQTYDKMHAKGAESWFDDGELERQAILDIGRPWKGKTVLELGCGEGDLLAKIFQEGADVGGIDYSQEAINHSMGKYPHIPVDCVDYKSYLSSSIFGECKIPLDILIMQGVLEHLDDPLKELQWMIDNFQPKTVITSSPCFLNPRGIVWMTLDMLGAVMSKTDLHYLNLWEFQEFCQQNKYRLDWKSTDYGWACSDRMVEDLAQRIPLALKDGNMPYDPVKLDNFIQWLGKTSLTCVHGAVMVYRIDIS